MDEEERTLQSLANLMVSNDGLKKQTSVIESIPYMLTKKVENRVPAFPSWALTHIGASTIYSHSSGVNQVGFISGEYLLLHKLKIRFRNFGKFNRF